MRAAADEIMQTVVTRQTQPLGHAKKVKHPKDSKIPSYFNMGKENSFPQKQLKVKHAANKPEKQGTESTFLCRRYSQ